MRVALVPSATFFEDHFAKIGVAAEEVADGGYRGTWITQYAERLRGDVQFTLVVPTRGRARVIDGDLMSVMLVAPPLGAARLSAGISRGPVRPLASWWATRGLARHLLDFDAIYAQEYAIGRFPRLVRDLQAAGYSRPLIGGHHGTSIEQAPRWWSLALPRDLSSVTLTTLTALEEDRVRSSVGGAHIALLRNPVDEQFRGSSARAGSTTAIWVGRLEDRAKDVRLLVATARELERRGSPISLVVVGAGPDAGLIEHAIAEQPSLGDRLRLLGRIDDQHALVSQMSDAFALLNTSRVEGFPITVAEALSLGLRCVVTDLPYVRSELSAIDAVGVVTDRTPAAVADMLEKALAAAGEDRAGARSAAIETARAMFDPDLFRTRLVDLFQGQ